MMLNTIIGEDMFNCHNPIINDATIKKLEYDLYEELEHLDRKTYIKLEEIFDEYTARLMRIAYLQGIKDFNSMFIDLKESPETILKKYNL